MVVVKKVGSMRCGSDGWLDAGRGCEGDWMREREVIGFGMTVLVQIGVAIVLDSLGSI